MFRYTWYIEGEPGHENTGFVIFDGDLAVGEVGEEEMAKSICNAMNNEAALRLRIAELEGGLADLLEVCHCTNGCDPDDMSCATNRARALLANKAQACPTPSPTPPKGK